MADEATQIMDAVNELRLEVKKSADWKALDKEKLDRINIDLDRFEEKNQALTLANQKAANDALELNKRIDSLEAELARGSKSTHGTHYSETPEYKALHKLIRTGSVEPEEKALLRTDIDTAGGYLVTRELDAIITKGITEISAMRQVARVRRINAKTLEMAVRSAIPTVAYEGEAEEGIESASTYGAESLTAYRQTVTIPVTIDMLMDSAFNMETEIMADAQEAFAQSEGAKFVSGSGKKQPFGFLNDTRVSSARETAASGLIDASSLILLAGDLKIGYNPVYGFSRATLAAIRTLVSTTGDFLWQPGLNGVVASTINGYPYVVMQDMPAIAAGSLSAAFGDFMRGYTIVDRTGMSIIRDDLTQKKKAIVEFTFNRWNYGQVVLPEAIKILKIKA